MKTSKTILAIAAAAGLSAAAMAGSASASNPNDFTLVSSALQSYDYFADIQGFGTAYASPITFQVSGYPEGDTSLFGFCFDIYHDMYLGNLGYVYKTNQPDGGGLDPLSPQTLSNTGNPANPLDPLNQISAITNLVDTGWIMKQQGTAPNLDAQLAAIQAAIWNIEAPGKITNVRGSNSTETALVQQYYTAFSTGAYTTLATSADKVFTITDDRDTPAHQTFAIGWPVENGVPEPATWALMIGGFGLAGAALRRQRKAAATA